MTGRMGDRVAKFYAYRGYDCNPRKQALRVARRSLNEITRRLLKEGVSPDKRYGVVK